MIPAASTTRDPASSTAPASWSLWKYISTLVVTPRRSISTEPSSMPARMSEGRIRASAGQITSCSQRSSGRSPPMPRSTVIGLCACAFTRPGNRIPAQCLVTASPMAPAAGPQ